jgi:membrane protein YdbS with pleckstrin-like domain
MLCNACQTEAPADSAFCPKCGKKLEAAAASPNDRIRQRATEARASTSDADKPLWHGSYSAKAMVGRWLLALVITIVAVIVGIISANPAVFFLAIVIAAAIWLGLGAWLFYQRLSVEYELSTQRFIHRFGVMQRVTNRIEVIDIDDVQVVQGFVERLLSVGTIRILSSDTSDPVLIMPGIDRVNEIATLIDNTRRDERRKRGLHIEAV